VQWQVYSKNPIIPSGKTGEWDELCSAWGSVISRNGKQWLMFYSGRDSSRKLRIGVAFSEDGLNWKKYEKNPVLSCGPSGSWDSDDVYCPIVWKENELWNMIFTGIRSNCYQIGIAQSNDGLKWNKSRYNPVFCSSIGSNVNRFGKPETEGWGLFFDESGYYLLHNSVMKKPREVYVAHSQDLVSWKEISSFPLLASEGHWFQLGYMKYCAWPLKFHEHFLIFSAVSDRRYKKSAIGLWKINSLLKHDKAEFLGYILKQRPGWQERELDTPYLISNPENGYINCYFGGRSRKNTWTEGVASISNSVLEAYLECRHTNK
jgi:predicted GH43/DUF377 family glycosyl hydrolase